MKRQITTGLGLGIVSAVVFASATTGPLFIRFALFFITALPIALSGLGWGWPTAAIAGLAGSILIALAISPVVAILFAASQALPMVLLTYLALLHREVPESPTTPAAMEWYPPGQLVIWTAAIASVLAFGSLGMLGGDLEALRKALSEFIEATVKAGLPEIPGATQLNPSEIQSLTEVTLSLLPAASALSWMASLLFNLWLAGRITLASGQLARPWPDLAGIDYPRGTALIFGAALLASMASGMVQVAASSVAGVLLLAYVLLGLAIVHYTTRGQTWRPFALWALYAALLLANIWVGVLIAILGLAETVLQLRRRYPPRSGPPASSIAG